MFDKILIRLTWMIIFERIYEDGLTRTTQLCHELSSSWLIGDQLRIFEES